MNRTNDCFPELSRRFVALIGIVACVAAPSFAATAAIRTVALMSQPAPGTPSGVTFGSFSVPVLNDSGRVAFYAGLNGTGVVTANGAGIWSEGLGSLSLVARSGSQAPGLPAGVNYGVLHTPLFNNAGHVAFRAGATSGSQGIWSDRAGSVGIVVHSSSQLPDTPIGYSLGSFDSFAFNNASQVAIWAFLNPNDTGIWSEGPGSLTRIAISRTQSPGQPNGVMFPLLSSPVLNDLGQNAFSGGGIWSDAYGTLERIAGVETQPPGVPSGVNYAGFGSPLINNNHQIAFTATLNNSGGYGIWAATPGNLSLVVRTETQAPGLPDGTKFTGLGLMALNNVGQIAIKASFSQALDTWNQGIWVSGPNGVDLIAHSGDQAPELPPGVVFHTFSTTNDQFITRQPLNDAGQIAFGANLDGNGIDDSNNFGLWATDPAGTLRLIVRTGDLLEVVPGEFRTISGLKAGGFNNIGQVAFRATFTDGSQGLFVSSIAAIPEPTSMCLLILGTVGGVSHRFRRRTICDQKGRL